MAAGQVNRIVHHLRWLAQAQEGCAGTDGQLLDRFIGRRDEAAFAELVRRHGPMVLGVCRRVLGNVHDAEDAFQAAFMVLVRKARSVRPRELVGNWLHGVACRVALDAQARAARRRAREQQVVDMPHPTTRAPADPDLRPMLDLELSRLPEKYRVPIVLCELEGRSRKDVARQLGIPEGTLSSRLATGRKLLAARLTRHGLPLGAAALTAALAASAASGAVPGTLAISTVQAAAAGATAEAVALGLLSAQAAALTEGVMKAMLISKLKTLAAVVVTFGLLTTSAGVMTLTADEPSSGQSVVQTKNPGAPAGEAPRAAKPTAPADLEYLIVDPKTGKIVQLVKQKAPDWSVLPIWDPNTGKIVQRVKQKTPDWSVPELSFEGLRILQSPAGPPTQFRMLIGDQKEKLRVLIGDQKEKPKANSTKGNLELEIYGLQLQRAAQELAQAGQGDDGAILVIRVPKKGNAKRDAEFLRRICKEVAKREPTPIEMHYFLKDTSPQKYAAVIESLLQRPQANEGVQVRWMVAPQPTQESRAEAYVKEKLGKKELTVEERKLVQKVLEFSQQKSQPQAAPAGDGTFRLWFEGAPKKQAK